MNSCSDVQILPLWNSGTEKFFWRFFPGKFKKSPKNARLFGKYFEKVFIFSSSFPTAPDVLWRTILRNFQT